MNLPTVRPATLEDMAAIRAAHARDEERMGVKMDMPEFFVERAGKVIKNPVIGSAFVCEQDGEIIGGCYQEKCVENVHFGFSDPRAHLATAALRHQAEEPLFRELGEIGIRFVHTMVPAEFVPLVEKHLKSSLFTSTGYVHFHRRVGR